MVWASSTDVTRLSPESAESVWEEVLSLRRLPKAISAEGATQDATALRARPVCCFSLQKNCWHGDKCPFNHNHEDVKVAGCTFGPHCYLGHSEVLLARQRQRRSDHARGGKSMGISLSNDPFELASHKMHCPGMRGDETDPLWSEICEVLRRADACLREAGENGRIEEEDDGDENLTNGTKKRLMDKGWFEVVDDDTSDEWLCVPAKELQIHMADVKGGLAVSRQHWLHDETAQARIFCQIVLEKLDTLPTQPEELQQSLTGLQVEVRQLKEQLDSAWVSSALVVSPTCDMSLPLPGISSNDLLEAGRSLASSEKRFSELLGTASQRGILPSGLIDLSEMQSLLWDIEDCLQRCALLLCSLSASPRQGADTSSAPQGGKAGSGGAARKPEASLHSRSRSRSRSPRKGEGQLHTLEDIVEAAAARGEKILVHHRVPYWGANDAI